MAKVEVAAERHFRDDLVEAEFIAYLIRKKPMIVTKVQSEWFSSIVHRNIVAIEKDCKSLLGQSTLLAELKSRKMIGKGEGKIYQESIDKIYDIQIRHMSDKSASIALDRIIEMYEGRSILYGIRDMVTSLKNTTVSEMKKRMKELGTGVQITNEMESGDYVKGFKYRLEVVKQKRLLAAEGKNVGVPTGIRVFDSMIGGLMKSEFAVIAGQPGVGKSAMLGAIATYNWTETDYNGIIITGEMPKIDFEFRIDSDVASIPATKFRFGNLNREEVQRWKKTIEQHRDQRSNFLEVVSFPRNFTVADIEGHALMIQDMYEQEIDYICLQLILDIHQKIGRVRRKLYGS